MKQEVTMERHTQEDIIKKIKEGIEKEEKEKEAIENLAIIIKTAKNNEERMQDDDQEEEEEEEAGKGKEKKENNKITWTMEVIEKEIKLEWILERILKKATTGKHKDPETYHQVNEALKAWVNVARDYEEAMDEEKAAEALFENIDIMKEIQEKGDVFPLLKKMVGEGVASMIRWTHNKEKLFPNYEGKKQHMDRSQNKPKQFVLYDMIVEALVDSDLAVADPLRKALARDVSMLYVRHCGALSMIHKAMAEDGNVTMKIRFLEFVMDMMQHHEATLEDDAIASIWAMVDVLVVSLMDPKDPLTLLNTLEFVNMLIAHAQKVSSLGQWFFNESETFVAAQRIMTTHLRDPLLGHACLHALGQMSILLAEYTTRSTMSDVVHPFDDIMLTSCLSYLGDCEDEVTMALLIRVIGALCAYQTHFLSFMMDHPKATLLCLSSLTSPRRVLFKASLQWLTTLLASTCIPSAQMATVFHTLMHLLAEHVLHRASASHLVAYLLDCLSSSQRSLLLDQRLAIYRLFRVFALHDFALKYMMLDYPLCLPRLLVRSKEDEREGQLARFDIFTELVAAQSRFQLFSDSMVIRIKTYVHRGPFYMPPSEAKTKMQQENIL